MTGSSETVHVVFGSSVAETLREALSLLGRMERVIGLPDTLSVGPIDPPDPAFRRAWNTSVLRAECPWLEGRNGDPIDVEAAWTAATAPGIDPVFWGCLRSPMEHACFLAFAARMEGRCFDFVDATNLDFTTADGIRSPWSLGLMRVQDIVASNLHATRRPVSAEECRAASRAWSALRLENAPLRIVRDGRLVSVPLTHYDALLLAEARREWEIAARLIGRAITKLCFENTPPGQGTSEIVLFGRILALGEHGALEIAGPGPGMRNHQVRRPSA